MFIEYGKLSTMVYEITKPVGKSLDGDLEYYFEKLKEIKGPILEAGVGTGRLLIPFLQKVLEMEGIDLSNEMLEQCRINMAEHKVDGVVFQGDLTKLDI
ncbi:MAG: class I SAM-dependent methyltransferase, partial [Vagococcus sp.]